MRLLRNPHVAATSADEPGTAEPVDLPPGALARPLDLHRLLDGYELTPLLDVPPLAERVGVGRFLVKHEAQRLGLPAFKVIGASWATYRLLAKRAVERHGSLPAASSFDELRGAFTDDAGLTLVTATDGNHGRAVARAARWFGLAADIYMPAGTAAARVSAIESEGARVTVVDGDYDHAVATAATTAGPDRLVVSDTSWPGYVEVPRWIAEGYATIFDEIDEQIGGFGVDRPDAVVVPVGVGAFAQAMLDHWPEPPPDGPVRIAVEPAVADCLLRSIEAGRPATVPGPHESIMAGMNCGTVSMVAWPVMAARIDWCTAIEDRYAADAMRLLANEGIVVGETGAAAVAAWLAIAEEAPGVLRDMGLDDTSTVLALCTEGATDPANYERIVGTAPPLSP